MGTDYPHLKGKARRFAKEAAEHSYYEGVRRQEQRRKASLKRRRKRAARRD